MKAQGDALQSRELVQAVDEVPEGAWEIILAVYVIIVGVVEFVFGFLVTYHTVLVELY
jgi:hypothetical protein